MQRKGKTLNEEKLLKKVISEIECCLCRIFDYAGFPNDNKQFEQVIYWFYDTEEHKFCLKTDDYAKRTEVTLAKINVLNDTKLAWMNDSLEEFMSFNIPKYFENFTFVIRGYSVRCEHTEQNTPLECTFFFSK